MAKLFVAYTYATGVGNHVFEDAAPPRSADDLEALQARLAASTRIRTPVITNWIPLED